MGKNYQTGEQVPSTQPPREPLLIVGASVRAAACSAIRAGFAPLAADKFADTDLAAACPTRRVADYPRSLLAAVADWPPCGWMYTGALENHLALVDTLRSRQPLYGNPGPVLRQVRDPFLWTAALREAGLPYLDVAPLPPASGGAWLRKPWDSCGGSRIEFAEERDCVPSHGEAIRRRRPSCYFQRYQPGLTGSAVYVANGQRAVLLGATQQLTGTDWTGARGFQYAGSVGPLPLDGNAEQMLIQLGECLTGRFGLAGLFGVDWILAGGVVWPVEVNPRYTASVEVLEQALLLPAVAWHVSACRAGSLPTPLVTDGSRYVGKAIVYAGSDVTVPDDLEGFVRETNADYEWPCLADVPAAGQRIPTGQPILTALAAASTLAEAEQGLREFVRTVQARLGGA
jgi:predicted ATP-grasp superfamily ATP-dependent carboligase